VKIRNKSYVFGKQIIASIQIATLAAAILFVASCDNETKETEKKDPCICDPKEHNEGDECCTGDGCTCKIILKCDCTPCTLHEDKSKECRGPLNCNCENAYAKLANGIFITMDDAVTNNSAVLTVINSAFSDLEDFDSASNTILKNNSGIIRIHVVPGNGLISVALVDGKHIITIKALSADANDLAVELWNLAQALPPMLGMGNAKGTVRGSCA